MSSGIITELSKDIPNVDALLIGITHVHASCITHDNTEATFLPPLSYAKMIQWWQDRFEEVISGSRHVWVDLQPTSTRKTQTESPFSDKEIKPIYLDSNPDESYEVAGVVALAKPVTETGSFRGEVHKLLVSPNHRQKGVARRLMVELERVALKEDRTSLVLDTEVGSPAEHIYPKWGYKPVGILPENGYSPVKGKLCDELILHKNLLKGTLT